MSTTTRLGIACFILSGLAPTLTSRAQSVYLSPRDYSSGVLEALRPSLDSRGSSLLTAAYRVTYQFGVGRTGRTFLLAALPVSHTSLDGEESKTAIGNPYLGVTWFSRRDPVAYEFGVGLPLASDNGGGLAGSVGDFDRFESYAPDLLSFKASLIYYPSRSGDWVMFTRASPVLTIDTGDPGDEARGEFLIDYSVQFLYFGRVLQGGLGFTGRAAITEDGNFGERTVHHVGITLLTDLGYAIPGFHFRLPLDGDLRDVVEYSLGVVIIIPL